MNVVRHSATELVVHEGIFATALIGSVLVAAGGGMIMAFRAAHPASGIAIVYLVGGLFALLGVALLIASADRRFEFDGVTRTARMIVRRLVHRTMAEYPFDTLSGVALERSSGASPSQTQNFYRIVFLTRTGSRIPWTPYSTMDLAKLSTCVSTVRAFCGWAEAGAPALSPPAQTAPTLNGHPFTTNYGCVGAFLAVFAAIGLGIFGAEVYRLYAWLPTPARVLSTNGYP
jgi:hypothetical protein